MAFYVDTFHLPLSVPVQTHLVLEVIQQSSKLRLLKISCQQADHPTEVIIIHCPATKVTQDRLLFILFVRAVSLMALILINLIKPPVLASVTAKNVCVRYKMIVHT